MTLYYLLFILSLYYLIFNSEDIFRIHKKETKTLRIQRWSVERKQAEMFTVAAFILSSPGSLGLSNRREDKSHLNQRAKSLLSVTDTNLCIDASED